MNFNLINFTARDTQWPWMMINIFYLFPSIENILSRLKAENCEKLFTKQTKKWEQNIWKGLRKTILIILEKWHEYFDVVESPFWCEKSRTKEQNTKSINVGILCVYQYRFTSMPRKIIGIKIIILIFQLSGNFSYIYIEFWLLFTLLFIADSWAGGQQ